jgi:hypothetical protein
MANGHLYVFFHGLAVAHSGATDFEIVLPQVPGHVQKAGSWLAETSIADKSVLHLRGVTGGNANFSPDNVIHLPNTSLTSQKRAATLWLPKPQKILELLHAKVDPPNPNDHVALASNGKTWSDLATIHVFIYEYPDDNQVFLEGHYWQPSPNGGAISLHIISTSEEPEGKEHENKTEDVLFQVLSGYPGIQYNHKWVPASWIDPSNRGKYGDLGQLKAQGEHCVEIAAPNAFAFSLAELEHPTLRMARLALLGRLHQSDRRIADVWGLPSPLGDRTSNCMMLVTP